jgi:hypothetical protein
MVSDGLKRAIAALALGGATVALGGAAANTVWAQQTPTTTPTPGTRLAPSGTQGADRQAKHQQLLAALAAKLNVTPERLQQAMEQTRQELGIPERGPGGHGGFGHRGFGIGLDVAARAIGIDVNQLRQELLGKSLADVARAHNVNPSTVASALKTEATTRIDQAVTAGRLTAEQATQMKQNLDQRIDQQLNKQVPANAGQRQGRPRPADAPAQGNAPSRGGFQFRGGASF